MLKQNKLALYTTGLIFFAGISAIGLHIPRYESTLLGLAFFSAFFGYFWLSRAELSFESVFQIGIAARLILFFTMPSLSDDIYRFIWDGLLLGNGENPYAHLPDFYLDKNLPGLSHELFNRLNSKEYFSVYPPLDQVFFWIGASRGSTWLEQTNALRLLLIFAEIGSLFYLRSLLRLYGKKETLLAWFFLNPLMILEVTGNVHFEGFVIFFTLFGWYQIEFQHAKSSGVSFGLAAATKLLPLIYLPAVLFRSGRKKGITATLIAVLVTGISLIPWLSSFSGVSSSLDLYFQKFEFNASVYYLIREIGWWQKGYNMISTIGPWLSGVTLFGVFALAFYDKKNTWSLAKMFLFTLSLYLLLATTVHPWYILPLIAFGLIAGYIYPIVWSFFIFSTYFGYTETGYELSPFWIVLEYGAVLLTFGIESYKQAYAPNP